MNARLLNLIIQFINLSAAWHEDEDDEDFSLFFSIPGRNRVKS